MLPRAIRRLFSFNPSAAARGAGPPRGSAPAPPARRRNAEAKVRDRLAAAHPGSRVEVPCSSGIVDVVTATEIIEVKRAPMWKAAMGQVLAYSEDFPGRTPRIHLFGPDVEHFTLAAVTCERFGIRLTASDGNGRDIDVWSRERRRDDGARPPGGVLRGDVRKRPRLPGRAESPAP